MNYPEKLDSCRTGGRAMTPEIENFERRAVPMKLTVVFRSTEPMQFYGDPPTHRTVVVELTEEQCKKLVPRSVGKWDDKQQFEEIAYYILEAAP